jgi:hypothetical protein
LDRSIFEVIINAHYITRDPVNRARQYIDYGHVIRKNQLDALLKHHNTQDATWHDLIELTLEHEWTPREQEINEKYKSVKRQFETTTKRGKKRIFQNWSGKSIREMAKEVDHEVEYDVFYSELSSFTHADVELVDRFLRIRLDGLSWTQRANEFDVGNVFRFAATFFSCFLRLFGHEFKIWSEQDVNNCWDFGETHFDK